MRSHDGIDIEKGRSDFSKGRVDEAEGREGGVVDERDDVMEHLGRERAYPLGRGDTRDKERNASSKGGKGRLNSHRAEISTSAPSELLQERMDTGRRYSL
jgi:hypothetical protein